MKELFPTPEFPTNTTLKMRSGEQLAASSAWSYNGKKARGFEEPSYRQCFDLGIGPLHRKSMELEFDGKSPQQVAGV